MKNLLKCLSKISAVSYMNFNQNIDNQKETLYPYNLKCMTCVKEDLMLSTYQRYKNINKARLQGQ